MREAKEMLRPRDLAPLLGLSPGRVYQLLAAGSLPSVRHGRSIRIPRAAWETWLADQRDQALGLKSGARPRAEQVADGAED